MCGIFCLLPNSEAQKDSEPLLKEFKVFENLIAQRGPNSLQTVLTTKPREILFAASVLWLQGTAITIQPIKTENAVFVYNGDIFEGISDEFRQKGDTTLFFESLQNSENIIDTLGQFEGPFAFIYLKNNRLYFGRDAFGRRSLLIGKNGDNLVITSVAKRHTKYDFIELPSTGIFCVDLASQKWQILPWRRRNKNFSEKMRELEEFLNESIKTDFVDCDEEGFVPPNETQLTKLNSVLKSPNVLEHFCQIYSDNITKLGQLLERSVKKRILTQPKFCQSCFEDYSCPHAITGVLFSGGVDCAILALLAHKVVEKTRPIDLINVAFEKDTYDTPDRLTGRDTLKELQILCPERTWNFLEVNVTRTELDSCRKDRISDLIYPLNSILDDSLGCALWFASRALTEIYRSPCRTLLVGMGADELFGGYTRHRAAFQKQGWKGLHEVLEEDWQNLPHRNLARDDRVVSDHARQLRTPYLDEEVVKFVQSLNSWDRTFPSKDLPQGIGEKILLRSLAYHLGLKNAATFKKRALQFGSRIANSKEKGHQTAERLQK